MPKTESDRIERKRAAIQREYEEPLEDVVAGFRDMGYAMSFTAKTLNLPLQPFVEWCRRKRIGFTKGIKPPRDGEKPSDHGQRVRKGHADHMRRVKARGRSRFIWQWAEQTGLSYGTIWRRLDRGWRPNDAVSVPRMTRSDAGFKGAMRKWRR